MLRINSLSIVNASRSLKTAFGRSYSTSGRPYTKLTFFTKPDCMLCYEAKTVLNGAIAQIPQEMKASIGEVEYVNIEAPENVNWFECYRYDIPVLHVEREGYKKVVFMHRFDHDDLVDELGQEV